MRVYTVACPERSDNFSLYSYLALCVPFRSLPLFPWLSAFLLYGAFLHVLPVFFVLVPPGRDDISTALTR